MRNSKKSHVHLEQSGAKVPVADIASSTNVPNENTTLIKPVPSLYELMIFLRSVLLQVMPYVNLKECNGIAKLK